MKIKYFPLFLFIFSCTPSQNNYYGFDPKKLKEKEITLSELADDITYIPLDNSFPIGFIYNIYFINNSIYLSALNSGVIAFDRNGHFLRKIGSIGRGPGEYSSYYDFAVDDKSEIVCVLDDSVIKVYSSTGIYIRSISLKEFGGGAEAIELYNSMIFVSFHPQYAGIKYEWIVMDTVGNLVRKKDRTIPPFISNWSIGGGFYKFENRIYHWNPYIDTVFSILPDLNYKTSFLLSPGEHRVPRSQIQNLSQLKLYFRPSTIFETSLYFVIHYLYNKRLVIALVNKKSKVSYITYLESEPAAIGDNLTGGFSNDLDGGLRFQPVSYVEESNREYLFSLVNPNELKDIVKNKEFMNSNVHFPAKKTEFEKLAKVLKETDNPVLMMVRLKK